MVGLRIIVYVLVAYSLRSGSTRVGAVSSPAADKIHNRFSAKVFRSLPVSCLGVTNVVPFPGCFPFGYYY